MRVENLEHLLNEEATDINEMLKVTVVIDIIAIISSLSSPLSSSSAIYYIIASSQLSSSPSSECFRWSATYRQAKRASTSKAWKSATCDQTACIRKRNTLIEIWKTLHVIILRPKKRNFKRNMKRAPHMVELCLKKGTLKRNVIKLYMWPDYVGNGNW